MEEHILGLRVLDGAPAVVGLRLFCLDQLDLLLDESFCAGFGQEDPDTGLEGGARLQESKVIAVVLDEQVDEKRKAVFLSCVGQPNLGAER